MSALHMCLVRRLGDLQHNAYEIVRGLEPPVSLYEMQNSCFFQLPLRNPSQSCNAQSLHLPISLR